MTSIDTLQVKLAQQAFDIAVLALWAHAKQSTGHTHETIKAFTFRPEWLTKEQQKENKDAARLRKPPVYCDKNWHNALRLSSGDLIQMEGVARPVPPSWLASEAKKVFGL